MYLLAVILISCAMVAPETRQRTMLSHVSGVTARIQSDAILKASFDGQDGPFGSVAFTLVVNGKVPNEKRPNEKGRMRAQSWQNVFTFVSVEKFDEPRRMGRGSRGEHRSLSFHVDMDDVGAISAMMSVDFDPGSFFGVSSVPAGSTVVWTGGEFTREIRFIFTRQENGEWKREAELFGRKVDDETGRSLAVILEKHCLELPGVSSG